MMKRNLKTTCNGTKKNGDPCPLPPLAGSEFCRHHQPGMVSQHNTRTAKHGNSSIMIEGMTETDVQLHNGDEQAIARKPAHIPPDLSQPTFQEFAEVRQVATDAADGRKHYTPLLGENALVHQRPGASHSSRLDLTEQALPAGAVLGAARE